MNRILSYIKYNRKTIINLIFFIAVIIGIFVAIGYLK